MSAISRRRLFQLGAISGGAFLMGNFSDLGHGTGDAAEIGDTVGSPIKVGIIDPLSGPYKTSSIHDVHGANVAVDLFNKRGGVLGRPVVLLEADDASNPDLAVKMALKFIKEDHVDVLMGTFNGDCALAVSEVAKKENKLFMVTGAHLPELTRERCDSHTFVFMPNARMLAKAVTPTIIKEYGKRWFMVTADTVDGRSAQRAMTETCKALDGDVVGSVTTAFGAMDFTDALGKAKAANANVVILNLYGWDLVNALKSYGKAELAKDKIGIAGMIAGEQIGRPLGYALNVGIWGLIWDPKINTDGTRRFIQAVVAKYNHTPTSRCYLGYAAMTQILEAIRRAGSTETSAVVKALEGHEFDGLKEGRSYFRAWDHQHVQDILVGKAYGKELGLGHYQIVSTVPGDTVAGGIESKVCLL
ncbi:ABC transporter permease [Nitrospira sp.]|nr:ABC transporter permease [Nitrospira sp.]